MPRSAIYPCSERPSGFTLLEMVVVLALVALLGAVVMPGLLKMQEAWKRRIDMQDIADQLRSLGYRARLEATDVVIGREGVWPGRMLDLPPGWSLSAQPPVVFRRNGACLGGQVDLIRGEVVDHLRLDAPLCLPSRS
ncbi:prepilin-type N-terminal cleavage/methylation domain-containing protein [Pseudomonas sp. MT3]|nr:prepilin-type N-terminal cleavage/methylation domain-containing protein [uncultured Pseudomonas sp.]